MASESSFTKRLREAIHKSGGITYKAHGSMFGTAGWPDLWVGHPSFEGWVEVKTDTGRLSKAQVGVLQRLKKYGIRIAVVRPAEFYFAYEDSGGDAGRALWRLGIQTTERLDLL